jgi:hypothetical protein
MRAVDARKRQRMAAVRKVRESDFRGEFDAGEFT